MELYVGTSGYAYSAGKGRFYPRDIPAKRMLAYYGGRFRAVEINNSFYRMPTATVLEGWARGVPEDFRFALKAPQRMTHVQRLKGADDTLAQFVEAAGVLKARLGPLFFQLPPNLRKDAADRKRHTSELQSPWHLV